MITPLIKLTLAAAILMTANFQTNAVAQDTKVDPNSIYARIGGQPSMDAAIELFYKKVLADERVNYLFENVNMKVQKRKQNEFLSAAFGGPKPWEGKDMRTAHKNLALNETHFGAIAEHLKATLVELKVDDNIIGEIMTIAASTKDAVLNKPEKKSE